MSLFNKCFAALVSYRDMMVTMCLRLEHQYRRVVAHWQSQRHIVKHRCYQLVCRCLYHQIEVLLSHSKNARPCKDFALWLPNTNSWPSILLYRDFIHIARTRCPLWNWYCICTITSGLHCITNRISLSNSTVWIKESWYEWSGLIKRSVIMYWISRRHGKTLSWSACGNWWDVKFKNSHHWPCSLTSLEWTNVPILLSSIFLLFSPIRNEWRTRSCCPF